MSELQKTDKKFLERWANMYTLARSIPRDNRFDMGSFGRQNIKSECGTSACMAGHAFLHPWFRRRRFVPEYFAAGSLEFSDNILTGFWGSFWEENPFSPYYCRQYAGLKDVGRSITPKQAAKAVKAWMLQHWPKDKVEAAIENATATYDAKWVHKYTPWSCDEQI